MTVEDNDRIRRAEEIQLYTENRCYALEKESAELKKQLEKTNKDCAKEILDAIGIVSQRNLKIERLEKENAELKEIVSRSGYRIAELKHEVDELKAHCKAVDDVNAKMKCCGNCKHWKECNTKGNGCKNHHEKWELA